ncbi:hypothetical protein FNQ90_00825 [Streptomyces alkaliphilus]|uniref:Transposase InsH N-terminal domain-containing protein n=1 Tax=Streptomyces alkaliphilus TaxID=1472722 RepID=A0A7W3T9G3_9ACTN|nr:hypothetical protein [Streptomyces alkaliphilus]
MMWVGDRLDGLRDDKDFASRDPRDGRPGLSPAQLATVCVLQFLLNLSDRQAAEAVRCRIDFTYAPAPGLDDPGFHHGVLTDFRDRLCEDDRADRLLSLSPARIWEAGMVAARGRQRTDSPRIPAAVRDLTRLEWSRPFKQYARRWRRPPGEHPTSSTARWMPSGPPATGVRSGCPAGRLTLPPGSSRRERMPACSSGACRTTGVAPARKRCGRSRYRTSSPTPVAGYVRAPRRTDSPKGPCGSSRPTTAKPAGPSGAPSAEAATRSMSPRPAQPATPGPTRSRTSAPPGRPGTPRPSPASTPASVLAGCCPNSTSLTAATFPSRCCTAPCRPRSRSPTESIGADPISQPVPATSASPSGVRR